MEFLQGSDAAYIIDAATVDEQVVQGLTAIGLPGRERAKIEISQLRDDHGRIIAGGVKTTPLSLKGNLIPDDNDGQRQLETFMDTKEVRTTDRIAVNDETLYDFYAPDYAQDADLNGWQITKAQPGEANNDSVVGVEYEIVMRGKAALYTAHTSADLTITQGSASTLDCIERASGSFVTDGFVAGMSLFFEGSGAGANEGEHYIVSTVAALKIELTAIGDVTTVVSATAMVIHGGF